MFSKMAVNLYQFRRLLRMNIIKTLAVSTHFGTTCASLQEGTKVPNFNDPRVETILKRITGRDLDKIFATRREQGIGPPSYQLLTNEELAQAEKDIDGASESYLKMPAVMEERQDDEKVLKERPELHGYSGCNIVFTDISHGTTNRDRRIVVHQPNGSLRQASWNERDRTNFMFFQQPGQTYTMPRVLEDENLQNVFNRDGHVDALDLVCAQCEPDSPDYIRVHHRTYEDILSQRAFDLLRSTRHFGGLVYYLAKKKKLTWLLVDMLKRDLTSDACDLIRLYHILHPNCPSAVAMRKENLDGVALIRAYISAEGPRDLLDFLPEEEELKTMAS